MERTKSNEPGSVLFQKIGGGSFIFISSKGEKKMIKEGQRFRAKPEEIPAAFRDLCKPVNPGELAATFETAAEPLPDVDVPEYTLKHKGGGWYEVLDPEGKVVNESLLKQEDAEALKSSLE